MDQKQLWQLHRQGQDDELLKQAGSIDPKEVADKGLCELLGDLFASAGDDRRAVDWYTQADTSAARQALPMLLLRLGDTAKARALLDQAEEHEAEWCEANYLLFLTEGPSPAQRLEALNALLEEQYEEPYMAECAALYYLSGQELKGRRMAKKQLSLFPGGEYEGMAQQLLEQGADCAQAVMDELEQRRPVHPSGEHPGLPGKPSSPPPATTEAPVVPVAQQPQKPSFPEPIERCFIGIIGMDAAKKAFAELYAAAQYQSARASYELRAQRYSHFLIRGGPGSGKTMLSERLSAFLHDLELSAEAEPCVLDGPRLGEFLDNNGSGLEDALQKCEGRTVVIDGLTALFPDGNAGSDPGLQAKTLHTVLERYREQSNFILLGSNQDIDHLLTLEPTMTGMFLYDVVIEKYTPPVLTEIARYVAKRKGFTLSADAQRELESHLEREYRAPNFRGGKTLEATIDRAGKHLAQRLSQSGTLSKGTLMRIEPEDLDDGQEGKDIDQLIQELDGMTGLASVKEQVRTLTAMARVNREAQRLGQFTAGFGTLHMIFTGNAGTGKTTVARIVGGIYKALGILPQGDKVVECTRADLVAGYVGQTAPKVKAKVAEAMGGVLFIDEAYSLCGDNDSFGQEAVDTLVAEIENHRADFMVILAGYTEDMDKFLDRNQGLASRFPNRMEFADYTQEEMESIFLGMLSSSGKHLSDGCEKPFKAYIAENRSKRGFGNARGIRNLKDKLLQAQSVRLSQRIAAGEALTPEDFAMILPCDLEGLMEHEQKDSSLEAQLAQLNALTGLDSVKEQVRRKTNTLLAQQKMKEAGIGTSFDPGTLHMVFRGNAGTGKTTVARIIARIYNTLGLLPDGDTFIECSRADMVGQYQGQTAPKVKALVGRALGGVLFIDEAYSLWRDANDTFGQEAVDTLIAEMENHRKELMVILAGYSDDMDHFFESNQGLASRVPTSLTFEDYTPEQLFEIFSGIISKKGFSLMDAAAQAARSRIAVESKARGFGNARGARNIAEKVVERHTARLGAELSEGRELTQEEMLAITPEDISGDEKEGISHE